MAKKTEDCQPGLSGKVVEWNLNYQHSLDVKNIHLLLQQIGLDSRFLFQRLAWL